MPISLLPPLPIPNHKLHVSLCVTSLSLHPSPLPCLPSLLSVTVMLSQTCDDIDLENEPWYKFFSELEFGRPVSQGLSYSLCKTTIPAIEHPPSISTPPIVYSIKGFHQ